MPVSVKEVIQETAQAVCLGLRGGVVCARQEWLRPPDGARTNEVVAAAGEANTADGRVEGDAVAVPRNVPAIGSDREGDVFAAAAAAEVEGRAEPDGDVEDAWFEVGWCLIYEVRADNGNVAHPLLSSSFGSSGRSFSSLIMKLVVMA